MNKYRNFVAIISLGFLVLITACNLGSCPESAQIVLVSAAEGGSVASSDGLVTLDIPAGALNEDIEISYY